jgi:hypothetical protein
MAAGAVVKDSIEVSSVERLAGTTGHLVQHPRIDPIQTCGAKKLHLLIHKHESDFRNTLVMYGHVIKNMACD